jgi:hypothetical protein
MDQGGLRPGKHLTTLSCRQAWLTWHPQEAPVESLDEFLEFVHEEIGLHVAPEDAHRSLDEVVGWDSVHLLALLTAMERRTGRQVSFASALDAKSFEEIYGLETAS